MVGENYEISTKSLSSQGPSDKATESHLFFFLAAPGLFLQHVGSSFLMRDQSQVSCIGSSMSYPLDHQGSPEHHLLKTG